MDSVRAAEGALTVLPELSALPTGLGPDEIKARAEPRGGVFEKALSEAALAAKGYLVGSFPEGDGDRVYHTVVLAGPDGAILGRYRATHPDAAHARWATPGDAIVVIPTVLGRIGLASADELAVPELGGLYGAMRADILAAPAGAPEALKVEVDAALFSVPDPPTGRADLFPFAAAKQNSALAGQRRPPRGRLHCGGDLRAGARGLHAHADRGRRREFGSISDADSRARNLDQPEVQLIAGQQAQWYVPLVLPDDNACLKRWRAARTGAMPCL